MNTPSPDRFQHPTRLEMKAQYRYEDTLAVRRDQEYEALSVILEPIYERLNRFGLQEAKRLSDQLDLLHDQISKFLAEEH